MTDRRTALMLQSLFGLALSLSLAAHADGGPSGQAIARCAAISASDARLACYDALANRTGAPAAAMPHAAQPAPPASSPVAGSATTPVATVAAAAAPSPEDPSQFGLSPVQRHVAVAGPKEEHAQIVSISFGVVGHATIVLDSGQTWAVLDSDNLVSSGDKVVIKRAALGSFLMTTPSHHSYRVHRIQ